MAELNRPPSHSPPIAVILAGGSGTRLWPLSKPDKPKQYLELFGGRSLIQQTVQRVGQLVPPEFTYICSTENQKSLLEQQCPTIHNLIFEPFGKNTAAAVLLSSLVLKERGVDPKTPIIVLPADHYIENTGEFAHSVELALEIARTEPGLVTLGIHPTSAHTGYGYIKGSAPLSTDSAARRVEKFTEKPTIDKALQYIQDKNYYWNCGVFVWRLEVILEHYKRYQPRMMELLSRIDSPDAIKLAYQRMESLPVDVAILEKSPTVFVIPTEMGWSDVGSWNSLHERIKGDDTLSLMSKEIKAVDCRESLVLAAPGKKVVLLGVEDLIIVDTQDGLLVMNRHRDQQIKEVL